jgi:hypothetical protein
MAVDVSQYSPAPYTDEPVYGPSGKARRAYRASEKKAGVKGSALHHAMATWGAEQQQAGDQQAAADLQSMGIDPSSPAARGINPRKFLRTLRHGGGPAYHRLQLLQAASAPYKTQQDILTKEQDAALAAGAPPPGVATSGTPDQNVAQENHLLGQLDDYASKNLGVGLSPDQLASYRATMRAPFEQQVQQTGQAEGQALAASGIDPRSGFAGKQGLELERSREQGLSNVEQQLTQEDIAQRNVNEQFASQAAGQEEGARQFDVNARLKRLAEVEGGVAGLAGQQEQQRQYDVGYTESQRQADLARKMWADYAASLDPSTLEQVAGGIGGFVGGLSGGGGGGGMGG